MVFIVSCFFLHHSFRFRLLSIVISETCPSKHHVCNSRVQSFTLQLTLPSCPFVTHIQPCLWCDWSTHFGLEVINMHILAPCMILYCCFFLNCHLGLMVCQVLYWTFYVYYLWNPVWPASSVLCSFSCIWSVLKSKPLFPLIKIAVNGKFYC